VKTRAIVYDATENRFVGWTWAIGARLFKLFGLATYIFGATSWPEAAGWLERLPKVDEVHFWGHGRPGAALINHVNIIGEEHNAVVLRALKRVLKVPGLFWLRTCSSFHGRSGKAFAALLASTTERVCAGSTYIIGFPWHSGIHAIGPGQNNRWPAEEGAGPYGLLKSHYSAPNTRFCLRSTFPRDW